MKKLHFIASILLLNSCLNAQKWSWLKDLGDMEGTSMTLESGTKGDVFGIIGNGSPYDYNLQRYDSLGNLIWSRQWDIFHRLSVYPNNDFVACGFLNKTMTFGNTTVYNDPNRAYFMARFDENANLKNYAYLKYGNYIQSVRPNKAGETFVFGGLQDTINFNGHLLINTDTVEKCFIVKLSPSYTVIWSKIFYLSSRAHALAIDNNDNMYLSGYFQENLYFNQTLLMTKGPKSYDTYIIKMNPSGQIQWSQQLYGAMTTEVVGADKYNNIYASGFFGDSLKIGSTVLSYPCYQNGCLESFVTKFSASGNLLWVTQIGKLGSEDQFKYKLSPAGSIYFTSEVGTKLFVGNDSIVPVPQGTYYTAFIGRLDPQGKLDWHYIPKNYMATGNNIGIDQNGDVTWGGMARCIEIGNDSIGSIWSSQWKHFMARYNDTLKITTTTHLALNSKPNKLKLCPNPSNGIFSIVPEKEMNLNICVYDITGACIYNQQFNSTTSPQIDLSSNQRGIYFLEAKADNETLRQKIIIE